ncbi:MAG: hypothetical protein HQ488_00385 [Parcubacteria group bacterium]|nr:hypothetical protein [Parcubacteria group bacterium]
MEVPKRLQAICDRVEAESKLDIEMFMNHFVLFLDLAGIIRKSPDFLMVLDGLIEYHKRVQGGGVSSPHRARTAAARRLWELGFGEAAGAASFDEYLHEIPPIPNQLLWFDHKVPLISLADPRPGLSRCCQFASVQFSELGLQDWSAVPYSDQFKPPVTPFWFRHDAGIETLGLIASDVRDQQRGSIKAGIAIEGLFAYVHHPFVIEEGVRVVKMPGTVKKFARNLGACIGIWDGKVKLHLDSGIELPNQRSGTLLVRHGT